MAGSTTVKGRGLNGKCESAQVAKYLIEQLEDWSSQREFYIAQRFESSKDTNKYGRRQW